MIRPRPDLSTPSASRGALAGYVVCWLVACTVVAAVAASVLDRFSEDEVSLPPLRGTVLADAARHAGCELRRVAPGERTRPPVNGTPASRAAAPGVYDEPPSADELVAAMRRGIIVIHLGERIPSDVRPTLVTIQKALPAGTIVTPDRSGMTYALAVTVHRRLLGCRSASVRTLDAIRLFRGRFVGSGPDR